MSKGQLIKPRNNNRPENSIEASFYDIIHKVVPSYEVDVENDEWEQADEELRKEFSETDNQILEDIEKTRQELSDLERRIGKGEGEYSQEFSQIKQEIENIKIRKPIDLVVRIDNRETKDIGKQHFQFPNLLKILSTGLNVYLVGPAGSGKTTAAINCANALEIPFHFTGAIASEFKLTGFKNAQGEYVRTEFREAYENGGLFLFDEIDASYPQAVLAFNAALANDYMDFPDKCITRHKNFYCIAAANTFGQGADRQYIGRNQLDAASLDRFVFIDWKFDENLERDLAENDTWVDFVQEVRKTIENLEIRHVVSPRASIYGAKLLAKGIDKISVEKSVIWKGLDISTIKKITENLENYNYNWDKERDGQD